MVSLFVNDETPLLAILPEKNAALRLSCCRIEMELERPAATYVGLYGSKITIDISEVSHQTKYRMVKFSVAGETTPQPVKPLR